MEVLCTVMYDIDEDSLLSSLSYGLLCMITEDIELQTRRPAFPNASADSYLNMLVNKHVSTFRFGEV
jgi:hypothetical protein